MDIQTDIVNDALYNKDRVISNIKTLISACRNNGVEVIHVRHDNGKGSVLAANTPDWLTYAEVAPIDGEKIFDKNVNSAFKSGGLAEYLKEIDAEQLILVGLQTEYCIDANCKAAFDRGYKEIIPEETNTTFNNSYLSAEQTYRYYNNFIWNKRYADVITMENALKLIENKGE